MHMYLTTFSFTILEQLANASIQFNFSYYLIATSKDPVTETSDEGWSKRFTSLPAFATWAEKTGNIAHLFSSYAQGLSVVEVVEKKAALEPPESKIKKVNKCDLVKNKLVELLHGMFSKFIFDGCFQMFICFVRLLIS